MLRSARWACARQSGVDRPPRCPVRARRASSGAAHRRRAHRGL